MRNLIAFATLTVLCHAAVIKLSKNLQTTSDQNVWFCQNQDIRAKVEEALTNASVRNNVDELQEYLEQNLNPYFIQHPGKWLVSVSNFHQINGFADDTVAILPTYCAINDNNSKMHILIVKVE